MSPRPWQYTAEQRQTLVRMRREGCRNVDIAQAIGRSVHSVRVQVSRLHAAGRDVDLRKGPVPVEHVELVALLHGMSVPRKVAAQLTGLTIGQVNVRLGRVLREARA